MIRVARWKHSPVYAAVNLAVAFWIHMGRKLLPRRGPRGREAFEGYYGPDGVTALTPEELAALPSFEACLACSLCDAGCPELVEGRGAFVGPATLVRSLSRDPTYFDLVEGALPCGDCRACEALCPTRVPIRRVLRYLADQRGRVAALRGR